MAKPHRICSIPDCSKKHLARGYCGMHLRRLQRHGDPLAGGVFREPADGLCNVEGCGRASRGGGRGMCRDHYQRWRNHGDPTYGRTPRGSHERWLRDHLGHAGQACLKWPFTVNPDGYGTTHFRGVGMRASRAMCILAHGEPPSDRHEGAHGCGKGHEGCVHPAHLRWALPVENTADKFDHGTIVQGEDVWAAKLTKSDVMEIRASAGHYSHAALASRFGVSRSTIGDAINRRTWKHVV